MLRAHPAVHVQDVVIRPSVRRGELAVEVRVANDGPGEAAVELGAVVEDQGKDVLRLPPARLVVPAGKTVSATLRQPWKNPPLWSHLDPHLLHLRIELSSGDVRRERFGFREFWTEGDKFFLNGSRINLLATSWWPPRHAMTREEIRKHWEAVKRMGCVAFRTHTQPWPSLHYEVADEVGLLVIVEGAVFNDDDAYRIDDPVFWDNYARHLKAMVDRDKNRPSVVMWSLENEFFGGRLNDAAPAKKDLVRMGRLMKEWDPTRPILYESDGDPGGVADCIGIHYPHEYPDFTCWPNEGYWLEKPAAIPHMFLNGAKEFVWKRDKPLYLGEFLWVPSRDPSWHTVFYGDEAYRDYNHYRLLAKAEAWKMQILAYRRLAVGGLSPWTVQEGPLDESNPLFRAHQYAYQPVAAYPLEYNRRFYSGETIPRRLVVFNEREGGPLELAWTLRAANAVVGTGARDNRPRFGRAACAGSAAAHARNASSGPPLEWELSIRRDGKEVFRDRHELAVFPRPRSATAPWRSALFDPIGSTRDVLGGRGLATGAGEGPGRRAGVLRSAGDRGRCAPRGTPSERPWWAAFPRSRKALVDFVARGGRVLVLRQDAYPDGLLDATLAEHRSTMTFPAASGHPALRGVAAEDLKFWGGDHLVSDREPTRPARGGFTPIVVSGSAAGLDHAPLLEQSIGAGSIVYCQLRLVEKQAVEPAAAQILWNLIEYLGKPRATPKKTALIGASPAYAAHLRGLGLRFDELRGDARRGPARTLSTGPLPRRRRPGGAAAGLGGRGRQSAGASGKRRANGRALPADAVEPGRVRGRPGRPCRRQSPALGRDHAGGPVLAWPPRGNRLGRDAPGRGHGRRDTDQDLRRRHARRTSPEGLETGRRDRRAIGPGRDVRHRRRRLQGDRIPGRGRLHPGDRRLQHAQRRRLRAGPHRRGRSAAGRGLHRRRSGPPRPWSAESTPASTRCPSRL